MNKSKHKPKEIKEYIYLDNVEINSLLAQFEDGIPKVIQSVRQTGLSNTEGVSKKGNKQGQIGFSLANVSAGDSQEDTSSETTSSMSQEAISTVYNDYAVDIVTDELNSNHLLNLTTQQSEGNYVQFESSFDIIDPQSMGSQINTKSI